MARPTGSKNKTKKESVVVTAAKYNMLKKEKEDLQELHKDMVDKMVEVHLKFADLYNEHNMLKSNHKLARELAETLEILNDQRKDLADAEIAQLTEDLKISYDMTRSLLNRAR